MHKGLRHFKRFSFEISPATYIFQNVIHKTSSGKLGAIDISDDSLVYGKIFSAKEISPDPRKVEAILKLEKPNSASEVRSLIGITIVLDLSQCIQP